MVDQPLVAELAQDSLDWLVAEHRAAAVPEDYRVKAEVEVGTPRMKALPIEASPCWPPVRSVPAPVVRVARQLAL